ncbi:PEGA domain-containing protein [Terriglobus roseus]|uniref:PEGA domain-containing protein n=1 Tax=Terriglobus roseus TaxID=392734 RepID=A0A1H4LIV7_9BACT|nr:PEGA domain-containing protein [Terriglobus roseus]SEB70660.1 PEGA domain-containing protein [Terriglobus roseus]
MKPLVALPLAGVLALGHSAFAQSVAAPIATTPQAATTAQAVTTAPPEVPRAAVPNTLMDGTSVSLRIAETISSADAHVGQMVPFEVTEDVIVQGITVIPKGSPAIANVTAAESKKRMGRGGKLDVVIDSVRLADGSKVQLSATKNTSGGGHVGAMTGAMVATSIVFFPAAPLFLFMHGKDITIPKGTPITAFVKGDTKLDMARLAPKPVTPTDATAATLIPAAATLNTASLQIESSVPGADIEIDGAFAGNTPSTLAVAPGQHTIAVKKKGYTDWTRTMNVSGSAVHLKVDLETAK